MMAHNLQAADAVTFLTAPQVRQRFHISDSTLYRWLNDPEVGFPAPMKIHRFRYFRLADIEAFERRFAGGHALEAAAK